MGCSPWGRTESDTTEATQQQQQQQQQQVALVVKMQEMWIRSLGWEDPLEKGMAINSSIFAWRIPWTEEPGGLQPVGLQSRT